MKNVNVIAAELFQDMEKHVQSAAGLDMAPHAEFVRGYNQAVRLFRDRFNDLMAKGGIAYRRLEISKPEDVRIEEVIEEVKNGN